MNSFTQLTFDAVQDCGVDMTHPQWMGLPISLTLRVVLIGSPEAHLLSLIKLMIKIKHLIPLYFAVWGSGS